MRPTANGEPQFSPSDILRYLAGNFAAWMERYYHHFDQPDSLVPDPDSPEDELVQKYGIRHEQAYLASLEASGIPVTQIPGRADQECVELTRIAIHRGDPVIYQAALEAGPLFGLADFLVRVSADGEPPSYEPWDTKLARSIKPKFIVQLCAYAEMLGAVQGHLPVRGGAILGDGVMAPINLTAHWHTWLHLRQQFLDFHARFNPDDGPPDPSLERDHGRWSSLANEVFEQYDLAVLVAGISLSQLAKLRTAKVITMAQLAQRNAPVPRMAPATLDRLRRQARLQKASVDWATPVFEVLPPPPDNPRRGLALLPPESPGDVYFDIEGFPFADGGLEYLLGAITNDAGQPTYHDWWAHDAEEERRAFERFIDWATSRRAQFPGMHIYHYAPYEVTALKRLASRYGTREEEVDAFLRAGTFVDLYTVVRQGVAVGADSYSLKDVERLFRPARSDGEGDGAIVSAMGSVVAYEDWLESGEPGDVNQSPRLAAIRDYNREDLESTRLLAQWLRARQQENGITWHSAGEPAPQPTEPSLNTLLAAELSRRAEADSDPEQRELTELVAAMVEYHRREDKPAWWEYFRRRDLEEDELADDMNCLAGLVRTETPPRTVKRSRAWEFSFDPDQDTKVHAGSDCEVQHDPKVNLEIITFDREKGLLEIKTTADASTWPSPVHLVPSGPLSSKGLTAAMHRFGTAWAAAGAEAHGRVDAITDLVARRPPRFRSGRTGPLIDPNGADIAQQVTELVRDLDSSVLSIQGPPGTGKSSIASRVIVKLLAEGKRVAVTGQSHRVIINLMNKVQERMEHQRVSATLVKVGGDEEDGEVKGAEWVQSGRDAVQFLDGGAVLVGLTCYGLAHKDLHQKFDYVFIDEAGQYALANAVIAGLAGRNLVLVGDQQQLAQVVQGVHPAGSGASALEHMLQGQAVVRPDFGVLLDVSWRMHPEICDWISSAFYQGKLSAAPENVARTLGEGSVPLPSAGILYHPVHHTGNTQSAEEEATAVHDLVKALVGRPLNSTGGVRPLELKDILIVAPYNMQVRRIAELVPGARVASIDKFQGQEAPVVILSMCASTLEEVTRGVSFLLEPNRLNVAVSRAQTLAIVVASPELLRVRCKTVREMELMNPHCWLASVGGQASAATG